jgi:class 3 adenylate cyclase/tetratricopeptide (TPR) repeat protein
VTCESCGEHNREGAKFCAECGAPLARACTKCSAELRPAARFCDECGTPTDEPSADDPGAADGAVRKTVTIVFADLVGSTAFGETVDPESARREMAAYHLLAKNIVERHGGTLVKFIGDGVMAAFGVPDVAEDDADRAVRAGLDLQREFVEIGAGIDTRHGLTVGLRIGINSGEIVVADEDADMVGDAINTAARIEAQCTPGKVLVGEQTWRLTRSAVDYEVLGEVQVKGKDEPVATFQVIATAQDEEVATPFVGRRDELATLTAALDDTIADGSPQLVTVIGSPGVGKTRLAAELAARATRVSTFDLRVDRAGAATFEPIADLLRDVVDLPDGLGGNDVERRLELFVGESDDRERLVPLLASFVGAAPLRSTEESLWAARRLVEVITAERPAVIVIDDIQWAEPLFLDLLEHLVEWVDGPAFLVALARPEIREIRPAFAEAGRRISEVVSLEGLDAATTEALAAGILGADRLPTGLAARLPESTQGNPLFVRELVRMLVDDGTITDSSHGWVLSIDVDAVEVPPTIMSLLASRVERMDDDERRVIEMAGIVGSEFARGAVASLMPDMGGAQLDRILERLRRQEVLDATGNYWGDEPLWRFHHVLIRDAAYRRLLKERRAELHRRVAEWTAATAARIGGEHEITVAFHYEQAHQYLGELGPLDAGGTELGVRAAELLAIAARRALDQDDLSAAGALAQRALIRLPADDHRRAELLLVGCEAFFSAARVHDGEPMLEELRTCGENDPRLGAWVEAFAGQHVVLTDPERLADAAPKVAAAAERLAALGDNAGVAKARLVRALILARQGKVGDAEEELDLALFAAREADDRRRITAVLGAAPLAAVWGPSPVARAGGRCLDIIRLLRITAASPMVEATSIRCQAVLEAMRGRFDESRELIARSAATVDELGLRHGVLETAMYAGYIELLAGNPAAAEPHLRTAYAGLGALGVGADAGQAAAHLARAIFAQGRIDEAAEVADDSDALAGQGLQALIASRAVRAEIAAARGDLDMALQLAAEAVDVAGLTDFTMDHADATRSLAEVLAVAGRSSDAAAANERATTLYKAKGAVSAVAPGSAPDPAEANRPHNEASAGSEAFWHELLGNMDVDAALEMLSPDCRLIDHRQLSVDDLSRSEFAEFMAASLRDVDSVDWTFEVSAIRGNELALVRLSATYRPADFGRDVWIVTETAGGLSIRGDLYEPEDFDAALTRLDQRYLEGEGAEFADVLRPWGAISRALASGALEEAAALADRDGVFVDHRSGQRFESSLRELKDNTPGLTGTRCLPRIHHIDHRGLVYDKVADMVDDDGFHAEWRTCELQLFANGLVTRWEMFEEHDTRQALARYRELTQAAGAAGAEQSLPLRNRASDVSRAIRRAVFESRDLEAATQLLSEDFEGRTRRLLMDVSLTRADIGLWFEDQIAYEGTIRDDSEVVAIRGDHLTLNRMVISREDSTFGGQSLEVAEIDDDGRATASIHFDIDDLAGAQAELNRRYREELQPEQRAMLDFLTEIGPDYQSPALVRSSVTDDFEWVDHRLVGFPTADAEAWVEMVEASAEQLGNRQMLMRRLLAISENAVLIDGEIQGGDNVWTGLTLIVRRDDRFCRTEIFPTTDVDRALARYAELTESSASRERPPLRNRASDVAHASSAAVYDDRDLDAGLALLADDFLGEDRRPLVGASLRKPDLAANFSEALRHGGDYFWTLEVLALAGDRLSLSRFTNVRSDSGFEITYLTVTEINDEGMATAFVIFEPDNLDPAVDEMTERFLAGEGAEFRDIIELVVAVRDVADTEEARALLTDDFAFVDHRPLSFADTDADGYVRILASTDSVVGQSRTFSRQPLAIGDAAILNDISISSGGGDWDLLMLHVRRGDRLCRVEVFEADDVDHALARFHELTAAPSETAASRFAAEMFAMFVRGDREALEERVLSEIRTSASQPFGALIDIPDGAGYIDWGLTSLEQFPATTHRTVANRGELLTISALLYRSTAGFEMLRYMLLEFAPDSTLLRMASFDDERFDEATEMLDAWWGESRGRETAESALRNRASDAVSTSAPAHDSSGAAEFDVIAIRGERTAVVRWTLADEHLGSGHEIIDLVTLDADGRVTSRTSFGPDEYRLAQDELNRLYLADEGAPFRDVVEVAWAIGQAAEGADSEWAADAQAIFADDFEMIDHRPIGMPVMDKDATIASAQGLETDRQVIVSQYHRIATDALLIHRVDRARNDSGGEVTWETLTLVVVHGRQATRAEYFTVDQLDTAIARFHELTTD